MEDSLIKWEEGNKSDQPTMKLKNVQSGKCFRFANVTYEEAYKEELFYIRSMEPVKNNRCEIFNPMTGEKLIRDDVHTVIPHTFRFSVKDNK